MHLGGNRRWVPLSTQASEYYKVHAFAIKSLLLYYSIKQTGFQTGVLQTTLRLTSVDKDI